MSTSTSAGHPERNSSYPDQAENAYHNLRKFKNRFDNTLDSFLNQEAAIALNIRPEILTILKDATEFVLRDGKRLRPAFMFYGYAIAGGQSPDDDVLKAATSVELFHAGALILDDIIDNSELRRGKPTVHKIIAERHNNDKQGEAVAIIIANTLITLAGKALSTYPMLDSNSQRARNYYDSMSVEINYGQYLDMLGNSLDVVDRDFVMQTMEYKTARYTVEKPLLIGASLAGASDKLIGILSEYAIPLGIAFQIQDDILGMFGETQKVGKPVDSDLKEGKKTLLIIDTIEELNKTGQSEKLYLLLEILGNPELSQEDYTFAQNLIVSTGALEKSRKLAQELITQAQNSLSSVETQDDKAKDFLLGISEYMLKRSS